MKKQNKRVPSDIADDLCIYCYLLTKQGLTQCEIANIIGKDRSVVSYYLERYNNLSKFDSIFRDRIKKFSEQHFLNQYRKTGSLNPFYEGVLSEPKTTNNKEYISVLMNIICKFDTNQLQKIINYSQVIAG